MRLGTTAKQAKELSSQQSQSSQHSSHHEQTRVAHVVSSAVHGRDRDRREPEREMHGNGMESNKHSCKLMMLSAMGKAGC
jgi:hypothetical protein